MTNPERTPLEHSRDLHARGLAPIPVPHKSKAPRLHGWQTLRLTADDLARHFDGEPSNIGTLLGEPAQWTVDVDLDHPRAVALADSVLPATGMVWGRDGNPRSHWLYRVTRPIETAKWQSKSAGMIVELRSTGCQTLAPGSIHPSGERVRFDADGEPATVDPDTLHAACESLANAVREELGEVPEAARKGPRDTLPHGRPGTAYAQAALRAEAASVASASEGTRNDVLNCAAFSIGTLVGAGELSRDEAERTLSDAARTCGLPDGEARRTIASGIGKGIAKPRQRPAQVPADSLRSPSVSGASNVFRMVSIADLPPSVEPDWVWPGYLARGAITLFTGIWKSGKSTMLAHLLRDLYTGSGLVDCPIEGPTLVLSEERRDNWSARRDQLGIPADVHFLLREGYARPLSGEWVCHVQDVAKLVREHGAGLVVFDTLPHHWPVRNENDAGEVIDALAPLRELADAGAAVLLVHHPRKGDGTQGSATRGSGALPGFVDVILELRRYEPESKTDTRRVLSAYGRFDSTPPEAVFDLTINGYRCLGEPVTVSRADSDATIAGLLPKGEGWTWEQVREALPTLPKPGETRLRAALRAGAAQGLWTQTGTGRKGAPFRYSANADALRSGDTHSERNEYEPGAEG